MSKRTGHIVECFNCQKKIYSSGWKLRKGRGKYCSILCSYKYSLPLAIEASRGIPKPGSKKGRLFNCEVCRKEFYVAKKRAENGKVKYCSRSCLAKELLPKYVEVYGFKKLNKPLHTYKYIYINGKRMREHRWIMEQHLGRKLEKWEHVHHINDNSSDNRVENLEILSNSDHQRKEYQLRKNITSVSS